ncbi:glycosyltransferase family 2 protein [Patescibacteria group bacterium]|nr:glycosyltransferase family 2 protein [Patescibacteria group bacterium]
MKISFIIPAYNEEAYLSGCLESLFREIDRNGAGSETEVIVVDNNSTDKTRHVAGAFANVKVISETKKGSSFARQKGFQEATGDILVFFDADVRVPEGWIQHMRLQLEASTNIVAVSGPYIYYDLPHPWRSVAWPYVVILGNIAHLATGYCVAGGNLVIKKHALEAIGGFDTSVLFYGDDLDVARRLSNVGKVVYSEKMPVEASARRFNARGVIATTGIYAVNFLSVALRKRPIRAEFHDVR